MQAPGPPPRLWRQRSPAACATHLRRPRRPRPVPAAAQRSPASLHCRATSPPNPSCDASVPRCPGRTILRQSRSPSPSRLPRRRSPVAVRASLATARSHRQPLAFLVEGPTSGRSLRHQRCVTDTVEESVGLHHCMCRSEPHRWATATLTLVNPSQISWPKFSSLEPQATIWSRYNASVILLLLRVSFIHLRCHIKKMARGLRQQQHASSSNRGTRKVQGTRNRASPSLLVKLYKKMSESQCNRIKAIGFGSLLNIKCATLPARLAN